MAPKGNRVNSRRTLKRPAAAKTRARPEPVLPNITEENFCLKTFISDLWRALNIRKTDETSWSVLEVATSGSGVWTTIHCLWMMLGKAWVRELYALEQDAVAAQFLMTNFAPLHVFQDFEGVQNDRSLWCWKHGCKCTVPEGETLFVGTHNDRSLQSAVIHVAERKPRIALLTCVSGRGNQDPELNKVMERLSASSGPLAATKWVVGDASPLPCARQRILFYIAEANMAERLEDMQKRLHERVQAMPKHCVSSMLQPLNVTSIPEELSVTEKANFESQYHKAFSKQLAKAIQCAKLPKDVRLPKTRPSSKFSHALTAWECAQVDVLSLMLEHQISSEGSSGNGRPKLADYSQSPNRGTFFTRGTCANVSTTSKWFEYDSQTLVSPVSFFKIHGHQMKKLKGCEVGHTFSEGDIRRLAGNGVTCTMMVCALTPVLLELGYLEHVPPSS
ncbi:unnamed protein product [Symbiodinium sp. CCMP2592]|nr:unnamed protein product [Symbiodinium sp. CCMP2592]CAE7806742.1 unnamed protein product [Symbiodinium sp. CCMP2592]